MWGGGGGYSAALAHGDNPTMIRVWLQTACALLGLNAGITRTKRSQLWLNEQWPAYTGSAEPSVVRTDMHEHFVHRELARHLNAQTLLILDQQRPRQAVLVK
jgi:hypothetical protein